MSEIIFSDSSSAVNNIKIIQKRYFPVVNDVEVEICEDGNGYLFVRHNLYWWLVHRDKNPDITKNCVIENLSQIANRYLGTIRWSGYSFKCQTFFLFEDGGEVDTVPLPLAMFEDFIQWSANNYGGDPPLDYLNVKLGKWLENNSLKDLVKVDNSVIKDENYSCNSKDCSFFQSLIKLLKSVQK